MLAYPYKSFGEPLLRNATEAPGFQAFIYLDDSGAEQRIAFGELHERALGIAHALRESMQPGDRALLLLPPGLDYVATIFGCFYAGVIGVSAPPPDPRRLERTLNRLLRIAESADVSSAVTTSLFLDAARGVIPPDHQLAKTRWLSADAISSTADTSVIASPSESDLAFLQYTSGSTADPRGVRLTHGNLLDNSRFIAQEFDHDPERSLGFNWIPPFHDMGLIGAILQPVYFGSLHIDDAHKGRDPERATSVLASPLAVVKRPIRWLEGVSRYEATTSGGPNFSYDMCLRRISEEECEGVDLSSWEVAFNGAEPIRAETMEAFSQRFEGCGFRPSAFFPVYGLAEATLMVTAPSKSSPPAVQRFDAEALREGRVVPSRRDTDPRLVGCGSPAENHRLVVMNPVTGSPAGAGEVGEIWISGPSIADGYWADGEEGRVFDVPLPDDGASGFLRTGDLGALYEGELYVMGRLSDLIIVNGRNHHPHDIESLAETVAPALIPHASAAFELPALDGESRLALVGEIGGDIDAETLEREIAVIRESVANELELPLAWVVLSERHSVPKTTSGKIQRRLCCSLLVDGEVEPIAQWRADSLSEPLESA